MDYSKMTREDFLTDRVGEILEADYETLRQERKRLTYEIGLRLLAQGGYPTMEQEDSAALANEAAQYADNLLVAAAALPPGCVDPRYSMPRYLDAKAQADKELQGYEASNGPLGFKAPVELEDPEPKESMEQAELQMCEGCTNPAICSDYGAQCVPPNAEAKAA